MDMANARELILWDADFVLDWYRRNETYVRLRARANAGRPAISAHAYGDVLRVFRLRPTTLAGLPNLIAEIGEHFVLLELTPSRAEAYAEFADACRHSESEARDEPWFAWQVALCRCEGHRIMTKAPSRYSGLIDRARLA